jgi:hypothetical protein
MLWPPNVTEELRNDVRFALRFKVGRKQQPLTDTERDMVAAAIVEHIRLCNWHVERGRRGAGLQSWGSGRASPSRVCYNLRNLARFHWGRDWDGK